MTNYELLWSKNVCLIHPLIKKSEFTEENVVENKLEPHFVLFLGLIDG